MNITKIRISRTKVNLNYENEGDTYSYESKDKPLPSFYAAIEALAPLLISTLGLPKTYIGMKPTEGDREPGLPLTPTGITIVEKGESRQVCIVATKVLALTPSPLNLATPLRYMDDPTEEGTSSTPFSSKERDVIEEVITEAKKYLRGERAQGQLPLEEEAAAPAEPEGGEVLPFRTGTK